MTVLTDSLAPCAGSTMKDRVSTSFAIWLRAATAGRTGSFVITAMSLSPSASRGVGHSEHQCTVLGEAHGRGHVALCGRLSQQRGGGGVHRELGRSM